MYLSGELARNLLEAAPDATVIVGGNGQIEFANAQVVSTFGYRPQELVGQSVESLLPPRFRDMHPAHRVRFFTNPRPRPMGAGLSLFGLHKDGREFPVEISLSPVETEQGVLVVAAIRDATLQKDTENQLVEANRAKSRFLASASHDLRQPLQTLNLLNFAARREASGNSRLERIVERQQQAIDSMSGLLASVLDITKLDSGAVVPAVLDCALDEIFERLRADFDQQAIEKGLAFTVEDCGAAARTDAELLRRLLGNLVSNAIRYTDEGEVRLACECAGAELAVEVGDTGIGMAEHELERIFDEFYQIDRGAQRPDGLGLGLSIVRRLASLLGHRIEVRSLPGRGTTFRVVLEKGRLPSRAPMQEAPVAPTLGGLVLVIDDEPAVAEATSLLLELEGFEVRIASCESEALAQARERPPDIMISDYHLRGGETGLAVVRAVRFAASAEIPAVFVTGDTARRADGEPMLAKSRLLTKPLRGDELLEAIQAELASIRS
ncbi:MAG TPA: ATP-binding protein [Gammaproteobacteria bacterium]|nr:ATP-binding protein [Gammaproteobacteria bacterium]